MEAEPIETTASMAREGIPFGGGVQGSQKSIVVQRQHIAPCYLVLRCGAGVENHKRHKQATEHKGAFAYL